MDAVYLKQMYELEDTYWWFVARRRLVHSLIGKYAGDSPLKILDAGAGTGALMRSLPDLGEVWGCDISPAALAFCRQRGASFCRREGSVLSLCSWKLTF